MFISNAYIVYVFGIYDVALDGKRLEDVVYIPQISHNFLYVYQLAQEGLSIEFTSELAIIRDRFDVLVAYGKAGHHSKVYKFTKFWD